MRRRIAALGLALLSASAVAAGAAGPLGAGTVAITSATIQTMGPAGRIDNGTLLIVDGRIAAVGTSVSIPEGARRIDARGRVVTPGLFNSLTRLGVVEVSAVDDSADGEAKNERITAAFDVADAINPRSTLIAVNRIEGLTRAVVAPSPGSSLIAGQGAVIHLGAGADLVVRGRVAMFASLGERGAAIAGGARGAALLRLRELLQDAADFAANRKAFDSGDRRAYAVSRLDLEALVPVVRGELPLVVSVHRASDIVAVLRLAGEFRLRLILAGVAEGWQVAREIAAANVPVLVEPLDNLPSSFERLGSTLENAARLRAAGVRVAFMNGDAHNARNVRQSAGNAVANGMPWQEALASLTTVPASIWGIADRYGSLEPGTEADLVIWDGDPLEVTTYADVVFIRGDEIPMESRQTMLRDRYRSKK
jgi:imidazolonepropionase-like amidohydrolase